MDLQDKHILVVTSVYPRNEGDRYGSFVQETISRLKPTGAKFTVFAPAFEGSPSHWHDGIFVHRFRYCPKAWENLTHGEGAPTKVQNPFYFLVAAAYILAGTGQLFWLCRRQKPDLLHVHWPFPHGMMAFPAKQWLKIPMIFSFHGAELLLARKFSFVSAILRWLIPHSREITANSSFTRNLIAQLCDRPVHQIPYGLTITAKPPQPRPLGEPPRLLFVGRLIERKGLRYLLQALPAILEKEPVRLRVVGRGDEEGALTALCRKLGIAGQVDFLGFLSNEALVEEYAKCDIFVLPSIVDRKGDTEGLGIVMLEALAHAKPVVASAVGGIGDIIQSGKTGLLIAPRDPQALADAIEQLLANPSYAAQLGQQGLREVQTRFSWSNIVPLWCEVFALVFAATVVPTHPLP